MTHPQDNPSAPTLTAALIRGAKGKCPNCGTGKLMARYSKQVAACSHYHEELGHIRADDGPAWLTILVVGHIFGAIALAIVPKTNWPDWMAWTVWPTFALALIIAIMPRAKGLFIALIWHTGCSGSEK